MKIKREEIKDIVLDIVVLVIMIILSIIVVYKGFISCEVCFLKRPVDNEFKSLLLAACFYPVLFYWVTRDLYEKLKA